MEYKKIFRYSLNSSDISKRCADDVQVIKTITKTIILCINSLSYLVSFIFFFDLYNLVIIFLVFIS